MASQTLTGALHVYDAANQLACFESGDLSGTNALLFVPGVGAGLGSLAVLPKLSQSLPPGWSLVQATTRSSYTGWLSTGGDRVAEDILALERHLRTQAGKTGRLALMGHSKGRGWKGVSNRFPGIVRLLAALQCLTRMTRLQRRRRILQPPRANNHHRLRHSGLHQQRARAPAPPRQSRRSRSQSFSRLIPNQSRTRLPSLPSTLTPRPSDSSTAPRHPRRDLVCRHGAWRVWRQVCELFER